MRTLLELLRILFIFAILGGLSWAIIGNLYTIDEVTERYQWLGSIGILLLIFLLYRNKLQFFGWFKGKGREPLPKAVSLILIWISFLLLVSPLILSLILN